MFKFESSKKRMSVIVKKDQKYYLFTKGADDALVKLVKKDH